MTDPIPPEEIVAALNTAGRVVDDMLDTMGIQERNRVSEVLVDAADILEPIAEDMLYVGDGILYQVAREQYTLHRLGIDDEVKELEEGLDVAHNVKIKLSRCCVVS